MWNHARGQEECMSHSWWESSSGDARLQTSPAAQFVQCVARAPCQIPGKSGCFIQQSLPPHSWAVSVSLQLPLTSPPCRLLLLPRACRVSLTVWNGPKSIVLQEPQGSVMSTGQSWAHSPVLFIPPARLQEAPAQAQPAALPTVWKRGEGGCTGVPHAEIISATHLQHFTFSQGLLFASEKNPMENTSLKSPPSAPLLHHLSYAQLSFSRSFWRALDG